jgi:hypothetical protein
MKLQKGETKEINYPSMDKYGNFAKFFGAVAFTATLAASGCSKEDSKKQKPTERPAKKGLIKPPSSAKPGIKKPKKVWQERGKIRRVKPVDKNKIKHSESPPTTKLKPEGKN